MNEDAKKEGTERRRDLDTRNSLRNSESQSEIQNFDQDQNWPIFVDTHLMIILQMPIFADQILADR